MLKWDLEVNSLLILNLIIDKDLNLDLLLRYTSHIDGWFNQKFVLSYIFWIE